MPLKRCSSEAARLRRSCSALGEKFLRVFLTMYIWRSASASRPSVSSAFSEQKTKAGNVPLPSTEGIGFITYLKGRGTKPRYAAHQFKAGWFAFEGKRHTYRLFEKKTRVRGVGLIRTVLFVGHHGTAEPRIDQSGSNGQASA